MSKNKLSMPNLLHNCLWKFRMVSTCQRIPCSVPLPCCGWDTVVSTFVGIRSPVIAIIWGLQTSASNNPLASPAMPWHLEIVSNNFAAVCVHRVVFGVAWERDSLLIFFNVSHSKSVSPPSLAELRLVGLNLYAIQSEYSFQRVPLFVSCGFSIQNFHRIFWERRAYAPYRCATRTRLSCRICAPCVFVVIPRHLRLSSR